MEGKNVLSSGRNREGGTQKSNGVHRGEMGTINAYGTVRALHIFGDQQTVKVAAAWVWRPTDWERAGDTRKASGARASQEP